MSNISYQAVPGRLFDSMLTLQQHINHHCPLDIKQLELIYCYVSSLNQCSYCLDMHIKEGLAAGETALRLQMVALYRDCDFYSESEKALLTFAHTLTVLTLPQTERDQAFVALKAFFNEQDIAEISLAIAQINSWNRLMKAFAFPAGHYKVNAQ
ncbi:carboxymuconolactone decarboxylase family protein [Pseudoalteromonas fenneropenaei]|uniref:Carboxymuconolactone decarboxylase family protein n=1 Tax=Pseudoalteromonas fenneropenaei TaxID=1737459 RepID=A0ABV7CJD9_9GAMM